MIFEIYFDLPQIPIKFIQQQIVLVPKFAAELYA